MSNENDFLNTTNDKRLVGVFIGACLVFLLGLTIFVIFPNFVDDAPKWLSKPVWVVVYLVGVFALFFTINHVFRFNLEKDSGNNKIILNKFHTGIYFMKELIVLLSGIGIFVAIYPKPTNESLLLFLLPMGLTIFFCAIARRVENNKMFHSLKAVREIIEGRYNMDVISNILTLACTVLLFATANTTGSNVFTDLLWLSSIYGYAIFYNSLNWKKQVTVNASVITTEVEVIEEAPEDATAAESQK